MTNSRAEEEGNEQRPEDLAMEKSLKASVMQGLRFGQPISKNFVSQAETYLKLSFSPEHFLPGKDEGLQWQCWTSTSKLHSERKDHVREGRECRKTQLPDILLGFSPSQVS
ncbi:unnamed protein product, partial [Bubo scandiacus]